MAASATVRDLRNSFPKVRKAVEAEGEVLITERGKPRYRLTLYSPDAARQPAAKDYVERMKRHQPRVHEQSRGER